MRQKKQQCIGEVMPVEKYSLVEFIVQAKLLDEERVLIRRPVPPSSVLSVAAVVWA